MNRAFSCVIFCALFFWSALGAKSFSATFKMYDDNTNGGYVLGKIHYNWDQKSYTLEYDNNNLKELFTYNDVWGIGDVSSQYVYRSGSDCSSSCEIGSLSHAMPQVYPDSESSNPQFSDASQQVTIGGRTCSKFVSTGVVSEIYFDNDVVCAFKLTTQDNRYFELEYPGGLGTPDFSPPTGCSCSKPIDIVIVLDRSGSIRWGDFQDEKVFMQNFVSEWTISPSEVRVSLVQFNTEAWGNPPPTLDLVSGNTEQNVDNVMNGLACCRNHDNPTSSSSCCNGWTSISSGMREAADELGSNGRDFATKLMVVVTDGMHNTVYGGRGGGCYKSCYDDGYDEGTQAFLDCRADRNLNDCVDDLSDAIDYVQDTAGDTIIYTVGVGSLETVPQDDLMIITDQHADRILRYDDFASLSSATNDLVSLLCDTNTSPCGTDACFCSCGKPSTVDGCPGSTGCITYGVGSDGCCKTTVGDCVQNGGCDTGVCNQNTGVCENFVTMDCSNLDTTCLIYSCDTAKCVSTPVDSVECNGVPCADLSDACYDACNDTTVVCDSDKCGASVCDPDLGCIYTAYDLDTHCPAGDRCHTTTCDPNAASVDGCVYTPIDCDDNKNCTIDSCDINRGCISLGVECGSSNDTECVVNTCNPLTDECEVVLLDCVPANSEVVVGAAIGTGLLIGIIVAVLVGLTFVGGSSYAGYTRLTDGHVSTLQNNPLYEGAGNAGENPLSTEPR